MYKLQPRGFTKLIQQLPAPFFIMGELMLIIPITDKGKLVENVLSNLNLCILNDGSNIYLRAMVLFLYWLNTNRPFFTLKFTLDCTWRQMCESDHFPIIVEENDPLKTDCTENLKLNKADWTLFESLCLKNILSREFENQTNAI